MNLCLSCHVTWTVLHAWLHYGISIKTMHFVHCLWNRKVRWINFPIWIRVLLQILLYLQNKSMEYGDFWNTWAIPWLRLWQKFENFSLLIDHSSYNKQAINHFVVDVQSTLGGQSTATPQKINLGQGQAQCPCNAQFRLWLRTKVGSASESLLGNRYLVTFVTSYAVCIDSLNL